MVVDNGLEPEEINTLENGNKDNQMGSVFTSGLMEIATKGSSKTLLSMDKGRRNS